MFEGEGFAAEYCLYCGAAVLGLFGWGAPGAVCWFVVAVIVDAVDGVVWRGFWPHVGEEAFEAGFSVVAEAPAVGDGEAFGAVGIVFCCAFRGCQKECVSRFL